MKIGVFIPYHAKLMKYLKSVEKCFAIWDEIFTMQCDYAQVPEHDCRNEGLARMAGYDYVFCVDGDEFMVQEEQRDLIKTMTEHNCDHAVCRVIDYKDMDHCYEIREHKPIFVANPRKIRFWQGRCYRDGNKPCITDCEVIHHVGYLFDPDTVKWKSDNYWDYKDKKGVEKIINSPVQKYAMPKEIRDYVEGIH